MHRIFFPKELKERIEIRGSKAHKISSVLRMNKEEKLLIFDGKGKSQIMKKRFSVKIIEAREIYKRFPSKRVEHFCTSKLC